MRRAPGAHPHLIKVGAGKSGVRGGEWKVSLIQISVLFGARTLVHHIKILNKGKHITIGKPIQDLIPLLIWFLKLSTRLKLSYCNRDVSVNTRPQCGRVADTGNEGN
jgi:hypothetical protein